MATVRPFKSVRPASMLANNIAALPYDVYNTEEAKIEVSKESKSFLRIDRAEVNFENNVNTYSHEVYEKARDLLYDMIEKGEFIQDEKAYFYLYRLTMDNRSQVGLVACTSVDEYQNDIIKKHELTRADKEKDRINHVDYCNANTGPIFLTYKNKQSISETISGVINDSEAEYDFTSDDGIRHEVFVIRDEIIINSLKESFDQVDNLYIADGHHRAASAVKVSMKRREENKGYTGREAFNYFLSVLFPDNQLKIMDYNRVVTDLNGLTEEAFLEDVSKNFHIIKTADEVIKPINKTEFSMYLNNKWYLIKAKPNTYDINDPVLSLDVSILQLNLLAPILGVGDPRADKRIDFVGGIRGLKELERRVANDMTIAFALVPTSIEELMKIADAGELMPPKSTWFEPKLRSGLFIHLL